MMDKHVQEDERYTEGVLTESELEEIRKVYFALREVESFTSGPVMLDIQRILQAIEFEDAELNDVLIKLDPARIRFFKPDGTLRKSLLIRIIWSMQTRDDWIELLD
jgi:hypothetical protein